MFQQLFASVFFTLTHSFSLADLRLKHMNIFPLQIRFWFLKICILLKIDEYCRCCDSQPQTIQNQERIKKFKGNKLIFRSKIYGSQ